MPTEEKTDATPAELTATEGASPALAPAAPATPPELATAKDDKKRWLIVCGAAAISGERGAGVIVAESHGDPKLDDEGAIAKGGEPKLVLKGYAEGADLYVRQSPEVEFPTGAQIVSIGETVQQTGFWGFAVRPGQVRVGPGSAAYAAANIAWQKGATDIRIVGLTDAQKAHLQPFIDALPTDLDGPADVKITLA